MKTLLNIACGTKSLLPFFMNFSRENASSAETYIVHNLDNDKALLELKDRAGASAIFADVSARMPFRDESADVVLAVSPYGFYPVNAETLRVLKPGGGIIVLGYEKNKFAKKGIAPEATSTAASVDALNDGDDPELSRIATYIKENYISYTTGGISETPLNTVRIWRKK